MRAWRSDSAGDHLALGIVLGMHLVPYLPPPAGPFQVGTVLWDIGRPDAGAVPVRRSAACPVSAQLWYPAQPGSGDGRAPYRSGRRALTVGRALGSHRRDDERRALVTPRAVSGSCVSPRAGRVCAARTPLSCRTWPAAASLSRRSAMTIRHVRAWTVRPAAPPRRKWIFRRRPRSNARSASPIKKSDGWPRRRRGSSMRCRRWIGPTRPAVSVAGLTSIVSASWDILSAARSPCSCVGVTRG